MILAGCNLPGSDTVSGESIKRITWFGFASPDVRGKIDESKHTISVTVPSGTLLTALTPVIQYLGTVIDPVTEMPRDFTHPVVYTVTAKDGSTQAYTVSVASAETIPDTLRLLIVGNSITYHAPDPDIGWYGDWGMAASCKENDYVHVLLSKLSDCFPRTTFVRKIQTIVAWEQDFSVDLSLFTEIACFKSDVLVIRLGENVDNTYAKNNDYYGTLTKLIQSYADTSTRVIVTGNFTPFRYKDSIQRSVALDHGWYYVDLYYTGILRENTAYGLFADAGVASHPSDAGMKKIAESLYYVIQEILFSR